jgi:hypothetical protein
MNYVVNAPTSAMQIADLREAIRWNLISPYQWKIHNDSLKFEDVKKDIFITL